VFVNLAHTDSLWFDRVESPGDDAWTPPLWRLSMKKFALLLVVALASPAFASGPTADADLEELARWMTGSFSSAAQSQADADFLHIVLHMARIWSEREDGVWLYVEQAVAETADRPYRQRVYRVRRVGEDLFASTVFSFPDPESRAGEWRGASPLADLDPTDLKERDGCTIFMKRRADGAFEGSTLGRLCTSQLRGATWASSEVVITASSLVSWDRGWDDSGSQIWGAEKGGYRFDRVAAASDETSD
jgi:hypothetical protein